MDAALRTKSQDAARQHRTPWTVYSIFWLTRGKQKVKTTSFMIGLVRSDSIHE
ncbi:hypothetical protein AVEN_61734-1, partial [Araneus ventricosus]